VAGACVERVRIAMCNIGWRSITQLRQVTSFIHQLARHGERTPKHPSDYMRQRLRYRVFYSSLEVIIRISRVLPSLRRSASLSRHVLGGL
jgi:hypothetical protein